MPIPEEHRHRYVYHFTHLDNLPGILEHGLLATNEKEGRGIPHTPISYTGIQRRRSRMPVPCGPGGVVHDYVPLYFCGLSPMLLAVVRNKIADEQFIIHFEFSIRIMKEYPMVFTDAAANTEVSPNFFGNPSDLVNLNWEAIDCRKWGMPSDQLRQARMAELLIHRRMDISSISRIIVWNEYFKKKVLECYEEARIAPPRVDFDDPYNRHYFIDFYDTNKHPLVTGPRFINAAYSETVQQILQDVGKAHSPEFNNLFDLRDALQRDMSSVPETAEIVDLESDNEMHSEDVGTHTLKVVEELCKFPEYEDMNKTDKLLVELGAFLHDIGKGPKSRWADKGGRQQVDPDHPIKALPMVQRILTEDVERMEPRSARVICKLVCYHDLVGDIVGKGRCVEELEEIVEDERELDMLIALGKADMMSVNAVWGIEHDRDITKLREAVVAKFESSD